MCFNKLPNVYSNADCDSETMDTKNWQEIFNVYLSKVEHETKTTLKMISDDLDYKGLVFDEQLKDSLLRLTKAR